MLNKPLNQDNPEVPTAERFETDTQKIVRRHLENQDDIITDEDLRSVRIGMTPHLPANTYSEVERDNNDTEETKERELEADDEL